VRVRIWVTDVRGEILVFDAFVLPGAPQSCAFEWEGSQAVLKIDIGGKVSTETIRH
jgi:hypothetical protein